VRRGGRGEGEAEGGLTGPPTKKDDVFRVVFRVDDIISAKHTPTHIEHVYIIKQVYCACFSYYVYVSISLAFSSIQVAVWSLGGVGC
jgi:hypothetical protein